MVFRRQPHDVRDRIVVVGWRDLDEDVLQLRQIEQDATHIGVATDHVIESFRNGLWPGYKTGEGIERALRAQFIPLEQALGAMGVVVWPMIELEVDDALALAVHAVAADKKVR